MNVTIRQKRLYERLVAVSGARECALNVILVDMGIKEAMTIGFSPEVRRILKEHKFQCEMDVSYLTNRVLGFVEHTTPVPVPGAEVVRRLYVGKGIYPQHLKDLRSGSHFRQGLLFGFPLCCILHFCRKAAYEKKNYIDVFQDFVAGIPSQGAVKKLDYRLMGGFVKYFNPVRVTEYIPCSHECAQSLALVDRNVSVLEQLDKTFKASVVRDFNDTYLVYGTEWTSVCLIRGRDLKLRSDGSYSMQCLSALPHTDLSGEILDISIVPHKSVLITCSKKSVVRSCSSRRLPWSFCFIQPVDTLAP